MHLETRLSAVTFSMSLDVRPNVLPAEFFSAKFPKGDVLDFVVLILQLECQ
jgi:hypothetical protein